MEKERYLTYKQPDKPHVFWTDQELFDEVDFVTTHRLEINPTGEREAQLKKRMSQAVLEQMCRYEDAHA